MTRFQRQDSLDAQLDDLHRLAVEQGMYDAANWLRAAYDEGMWDAIRQIQADDGEQGERR